MTFDADASIREMVTELQDTQLLAQIGTEDLIAKETKYHLSVCVCVCVCVRVRAHVCVCVCV